MKLRVRDVAEMMGVSESEVFRWIERERLPASRFDGHFRLHPASVYEWATARGLPIHSDLFGAQGEATPLVASLQRGGVIEGLRGDDREAVLRAAVARIHLPPHADREVILQMLLARERLGSSAVGRGIAIPHVRNPIVLRVVEPQATLCLLQRPIEFRAHDRVPVHALFLLISPTIQSHLTLLSRLASVLLEEGLCAAIASRRPAGEILQLMEQAELRLSRRPDHS